MAPFSTFLCLSFYLHLLSPWPKSAVNLEYFGKTCSRRWMYACYSLSFLDNALHCAKIRASMGQQKKKCMRLNQK